MKLKFVHILLLAPIFIMGCKGDASTNADATTAEAKEPVIITQEENVVIAVDKQSDANGVVTATVTRSEKNGNEIVTDEKVFKGTKAEVDARIKAFKEKQ